MSNPKLELTLKKHTNQEKQNSNVIGIVITENKNQQNSLILYIILDDKSKLRERDNFLVHGVEIEYYKNPIRQIKYNFKKEAKEKKYNTAEIFTNCKIIYKKTSKINSLIKQSKLILKKRK